MRLAKAIADDILVSQCLVFSDITLEDGTLHARVEGYEDLVYHIKEHLAPMREALQAAFEYAELERIDDERVIDDGTAIGEWYALVKNALSLMEDEE